MDLEKNEKSCYGNCLKICGNYFTLFFFLQSSSKILFNFEPFPNNIIIFQKDQNQKFESILDGNLNSVPKVFELRQTFKKGFVAN